GGDPERLKRTIGTLFVTILTTGIVVGIAGLLWGGVFLKVLATPPEAFEDALAYTRICSGGILFVYGYNMVSAVLRGMGDSRHPFLFIVVASVLNVVLDLILIAGLDWGVAGAGLATVLSQALAFFFALAFLYRRKEAFGFDFRRQSFRVDRDILKTLVKLGIPFAIRFAAINVSMLFVNALINSLGYRESAVFGLGVRIDDFVAKVSQGIMLAASVMIGQNFGAGKLERIDRIIRHAWLVSLGMYALYTCILLRYPREMYGFFTDDPEVLALVGIFVSAIIWHYPAQVLMRGTNALVHGIGNAWLGLAIAVFDGLLLRTFLSWFLGIGCGMGLYGFLLGYSLATWGTAIPGLIYYLFCPWRKRRAVID
ncbi:MAG: MATE family efflux transporter, partial [Lentisphaeria bacterium]|nr:MATE family efflux transporter [Lentisphaeria bacterium]